MVQILIQYGKHTNVALSCLSKQYYLHVKLKVPDKSRSIYRNSKSVKFAPIWKYRKTCIFNIHCIFYFSFCM